MTTKRSGTYGFANGPHSCGKPTALKETVLVSPGTVYVEVDLDGTFPMKLAEALSIHFFCPSFSKSLFMCS